jgi:membrane associated rhomboid family serine protease/Zn-finger nucleic acid-binding protein
MASYEQAGASLDLCHTCHGLWFDTGVLARVAATPLDLVPAPHAETLRLRYCPRCTRQKLERVEVRGASDIILDQCGRCQGAFVEAGTLRRIERLKAYRARSAAQEDARLRGAFLEEKKKREAFARPAGGVELEMASPSSGNLWTFLLSLPREEYADTESTPYAVYGLVIVILTVWLWQVFVAPEEVWLSLATVPSDILAGKHLHTLVTAVFLHGGWLHVLGNLYFFIVFADNVEDRVGHLPFVGWYLLWGVLSAAISVVMCTPANRGIPELGASGAISGAMGAYVVLFPRNRIVARLLGFLAWGVVIKLPAWTYLGFWMVLQFFYATRGDPGIAWWAHIGGFAAGAAVGAVYRSRAAGVGS